MSQDAFIVHVGELINPLPKLIGVKSQNLDLGLYSPNMMGRVRDLSLTIESQLFYNHRGRRVEREKKMGGESWWNCRGKGREEGRGS